MSIYSKAMISMELLMPSRLFKIKIQMLQKNSGKRWDLGGKASDICLHENFPPFSKLQYVRKKISLTLQNKVTSIMSYYHNLGLEKYQQKDKDAWNYQFKFYGKEHWNLVATFGLNEKKINKQTKKPNSTTNLFCLCYSINLQ